MIAPSAPAETRTKRLRGGSRVYWSTVPSEDHPDSNEDAVLIDTTLDLVAVFDGVGGYEGGEVASRIAQHAVLTTWRDQAAAVRNLADVRAVMRETVLEADRQVRDAVDRQPELTGMATTAIIAKLWEAADHRRMLVHGHVGDSRLYVLRARGLLERVTVDDGILSTHVAVGLISEEEALIIDQAENWQDLDERQKRYFYQRGLITQAIGGRGDPEVHVGQVELYPGDRVLVCSDGIHDNLTEAEIAEVLRKNGRNDGDALVRAARKRSQRGLQATMRSKPDDMSAVVIDVAAVAAAPKTPRQGKTQPTVKAPVKAGTQPTVKAPAKGKTQPTRKAPATARTTPAPKPKAPARPKPKTGSGAKAASEQRAPKSASKRTPQGAGSAGKKA
ncbi:MAG TPA: protein phosphatase 2C domain-containing protein [Ktedonobacterales bacterium]